MELASSVVERSLAKWEVGGSIPGTGGKTMGHSFFYPHPPLFTKQHKLVPVRVSCCGLHCREGDGYRKKTTFLAWWRKCRPIYATNWFSKTLMQLTVLLYFTPKGAHLPHSSDPTEDTTFFFSFFYWSFFFFFLNCWIHSTNKGKILKI